MDLLGLRLLQNSPDETLSRFRAEKSSQVGSSSGIHQHADLNLGSLIPKLACDVRYACAFFWREVLSPTSFSQMGLCPEHQETLTEMVDEATGVDEFVHQSGFSREAELT